MGRWIGGWMVAAAVVLWATAVQSAELAISHCRFPEPPEIPNGARASESDMGRAGADVREYVAGVQSSLECLTAYEESAAGDISEEQQAQLVAVYNSGVDQMNAVAEQYNEQVRAFKAR